VYVHFAWAARYNTWLLIKLTPKGVVFSFLFFSFLFFSFLFFSFLFLSILHGAMQMLELARDALDAAMVGAREALDAAMVADLLSLLPALTHDCARQQHVARRKH